MLTVHSGGNPHFLTDHLSLYISLCSGPQDDQLKWPFAASIIVQILNQQVDNAHFSRTLRLSLGCSKSYGEFITFISHNKLERRTDTWAYVKDDNIFFHSYGSHCQSIMPTLVNLLPILNFFVVLGEQ